MPEGMAGEAAYMLVKLTTEPWAVERFILNEREVARHNDPEKIRLFGLDLLANGQHHAVSATEDGRLIGGHQRVLGAKSAGIRTLLTNVFPRTLTPTQFKLLMMSENIQRADWTPYQKWVIGAELMAENPGWKLLDLAGHLHVDPSSVTRLMSPSKVVPVWVEALKDGKVGVSDIYAASKLPEADQPGLLTFKLAGHSAADLEKEVSKLNRKTAPAVKLARITVKLPGGVTIILSGKKMAIEDACEAFGEGHKECKKAISQGLTAPSWVSAMKDKAAQPST